MEAVGLADAAEIFERISGPRWHAPDRIPTSTIERRHVQKAQALNPARAADRRYVTVAR
jgi:hypothetical protein